MQIHEVNEKPHPSFRGVRSKNCIVTPRRPPQSVGLEFFALTLYVRDQGKTACSRIETRPREGLVFGKHQGKKIDRSRANRDSCPGDFAESSSGSQLEAVRPVQHSCRAFYQAVGIRDMLCHGDSQLAKSIVRVKPACPSFLGLSPEKPHRDARTTGGPKA